MQSFGEWLNNQLMGRDWKPADLARTSKLDSGVISNLLNGKRNPGVDTSKAISAALDIPLEEVYRMARILPPKSDTDTFIDGVIHLMTQLPTNDKKDVLEYVRLRHRLAREKQTLISNVTKNPKRSSHRITST